jgi:DNA-binding GntR family transcriptional regulator
VVEAIAARDAAEARRAMEEHVEATRRDIMDLLTRRKAARAAR